MLFTAVSLIQPWIFLSSRFRAGYIYTHSYLGGEFSIGHGFLVGFSLLEEDVDGFRLDLDYVWRPRHLPILPGHFVYEHYLSSSITFGIMR